MSWKPEYGLLLLFSTVATYLGALAIERFQRETYRKFCLTLVIVLNLLVLFYFKYSNMFMGYLGKLLSFFGDTQVFWDDSIFLPVGISFFTLQSLGYLIDVYRREIYAEKNILRYALFISFFPQLVAGPIERSKNLLRQLSAPVRFSYENLRRGLLLMLYGYFLKIVIADRLSVFVDAVYSDLNASPGYYIVIATLLFAIQIYCDFYGYSTIARGVALTMGIRLMDNFIAPYFSKSIREFWHRWHISLSTWFRDYLYIPLGGNRKGTIRKYINIMLVFVVSGLWHGASLAFVIWGFLHGLYQILETLWDAVSAKIKGIAGEKNTNPAFFSQCIKILLTFSLACFAWIFFRANSFGLSKEAIAKLISLKYWFAPAEKSIFELGISREYFCVMAVAIVILGIVDYLKYRGKEVVESFFRKKWWFRTLCEIALIVFTLLFGRYGSVYDVQQFIYFQF